MRFGALALLLMEMCLASPDTELGSFIMRCGHVTANGMCGADIVDRTVMPKRWTLDSGAFTVRCSTIDNMCRLKDGSTIAADAVLQLFKKTIVDDYCICPLASQDPSV